MATIVKTVSMMMQSALSNGHLSLVDSEITTFVAVGRFILLSVNTPGYGSVVARFNTTQQKKHSVIIGKLSALNIWDSVLTRPLIRRFSIGCGYEVGNLLQWRELFNLASSVSARIQSATCRHGHGKAEVTQQCCEGGRCPCSTSVEKSSNLIHSTKFDSNHRIRRKYSVARE